MIRDNRFYVYALLDPRYPGDYTYGIYKFRYIPFYIGKGSGNRMRHHLLEAVKEDNRCECYKCNIIREIFNELGRYHIARKLYNNLLENIAYEYEIDLIKSIGRKNKNEGPLINLRGGGEGGESLGVTYTRQIKAPNITITNCYSKRNKSHTKVLRKTGVNHNKKGSVRNINGLVYIDFMYLGERVRESSGLIWNTDNEKLVREQLDRIISAIDSKSLIFAEVFPYSRRKQYFYNKEQEYYNNKQDYQSRITI